MRIISPAQSKAIEHEIFKQALAIDELALRFAPPWGALSKARMTRLYRERALTYFGGIPSVVVVFELSPSAKELAQ
jgi:hypothetical protein